MSQASARKSVALNLVLVNVLRDAERSLLLLSSKDVKFATKSALQSVLFRLRVSLAKYLVAYRWSKRNGWITEGDDKRSCWTDMASVRRGLGDVCAMITSLRFETASQCPEEMPSLKSEMLTVSPMSDVVLAFTTLLQDGHFHLKQVKYRRKKILLDAHPYYVIGLKVCRGGYLKGSVIGFGWPEDVKVPDRMAKRIGAMLRRIDPRERGMLKRIDSLFVKIGTIGKMVVIVRELQKIVGDYDCTIHRENGGVYLKFSASFEPVNVFRIEILGDVVVLRSLVPIWLPPDPEIGKGERLKFRKEFTRYGIPEEALFTKRILCVQLTLDNLGEVMTMVHNRMFYCRVHSFATQLNMAVQSCHLTRASAVWTCNMPDFSGSHIALSLDDLDIGSIVFDSQTGAAIYEHPLPIPGNIFDHVNLDNVDIHQLLNRAFYSMTCVHEQTLWFRNHWQSLRAPFYEETFVNTSLLYTSFSSKYCLKIRSGMYKPQICVTNNETWEDIASPFTVIMDSLKQHELDKEMFDGVFFAAKLDIIVLSLVELLSEKYGFICQRRGKGIRFMGRYCTVGRLSIYKTFAWSLLLEKDPRIFAEKGMIIVRGSEMSINFVKYLGNLLDTMLLMCELEWKVSRLTTYRSDMMADITVSNLKYHFELGPWSDVIPEDHVSTYILTNYRYVAINGRWLTPCPLDLQLDLSHGLSYQVSPEFSSFLSTTAVLLFRLIALFDHDPNWTVMKGITNFLHFLYQNSFSMNVRYGVDACFDIFQAKTGFSSPLLVPIGNVTKLISPPNGSFVECRIKLLEMESVKQEIEKYSIIFTILENLKFEIFEYREPDAQHPSRYLYAKSTRFVLMEATVNDKGIQLISPSFPALRDITQTIRDSYVHSFDAKAKYTRFVAWILHTCDNFTITLLGVFKAIVAPERISRMDLGAMADESWVSIKTMTFAFCIIEDGRKLHILFMNPEGETVTVKDDHREAEYSLADLSRLLAHVDLRPLADQLFPML